MLLGFALKSAGTQAGPADTDAPAPRISVFGTIHPEIFRLSAPLGSGSPADRVRLASLEPLVGFDALINARSMPTEASAPACGSAPFEERFAALEDHPAPFDKRFASSEDCPASFDESLASAMDVPATSLRLPADHNLPTTRAAAPQPARSTPPPDPAP